MNYKILDFTVHTDKEKKDAGNLVALEKGDNFPFEIKRVYYIWGSSYNTVRGFHAHKNLEQVIVCLSGSCEFTLDDGKEKQNVLLNKPTQGLYISNDIWREFTHFSEDCILMVIASEHYTESDYVRDYQEYLSFMHGVNLFNTKDIFFFPFDIKRIFYIYGVLDSDKRGSHANRNSKFWMFCVRGHCKVDAYIPNKRTYLLNDKSKILFLDNMIWKEMYDFSKDAILLVMTDQKYDKFEYITDFKKYLKITNERNKHYR